MLKSICGLFLSMSLLSNTVIASDKLVLEMDLEQDVLSLSHNIDHFLFSASRNYIGDSDKNINNMDVSERLKDHLAVTALVRMNDEVVGFATEQEIVSTDPETGEKFANSMWSFRFNYPGMVGFMVVEQYENPGKVFSVIQQVMDNPDKDWEDKWKMFLSSSNTPKIQYASGELSKYQGGIFEEYNGINASDFKNFGRFRGRIKFVIYPGSSVN